MEFAVQSHLQKAVQVILQLSLWKHDSVFSSTKVNTNMCTQFVIRVEWAARLQRSHKSCDRVLFRTIKTGCYQRTLLLETCSSRASSSPPPRGKVGISLTSLFFTVFLLTVWLQVGINRLLGRKRHLAEPPSIEKINQSHYKPIRFIGVKCSKLII